MKPPAHDAQGILVVSTLGTVMLLVKMRELEAWRSTFTCFPVSFQMMKFRMMKQTSFQMMKQIETRCCWA